MSGTVCGICEREGGGVEWLAPGRTVAHAECVAKIGSVESLFWEKMKRRAFSKEEAGMLHIRMVRKAKGACGGKSIALLLETEGSEKVMRLFKNAGGLRARL